MSDARQEPHEGWHEVALDDLAVIEGELQFEVGRIHTDDDLFSQIEAAEEHPGNITAIDGLDEKLDIVLR